MSSHKVGCAVKVSTGSEKEKGEEVGVLELKSREKIKVLNGACVNAELKDKMPVITRRVKGKTVEVLHDTGCSGVIVRQDLVKEEEITNRTGYMLTVDRTVRRAPMGMVNIDTPYYTGRVEALCLQDPLFNLIVGNIEGARAPEDLDVKWDVAAAVVTRSQARKDSGSSLKSEGNYVRWSGDKRETGFNAKRGRKLKEVWRYEGHISTRGF